MPISEYGSLNTTALVVPDVYVQILSPSLVLLNGVPTNVVGVVGTAIWGPVGRPVGVGSYAEYVANFGPLQARTYDMGTQIAAMIQQGAQNFKAVRVTDGSDTAAAATIGTNGLTVTSRYTGSGGNGISVAIGTGSKANSYKATVSFPNSGRVPEVFDNITGTGNALWVAIASALSNGIAGQRSASDIVLASAGASTTAPTLATTTLSGGTDGATNVTQTTLLGSDGASRTGMYALRGTGASIGVLADAYTPGSTWAAQMAFGLAEGIYMIVSGPAGEAITSAASAKSAAGIDHRDMKVLLGDWVYWNDPTTNLIRMISPVPFSAGRLANLGPHQSSLNKPMFGVVGTQRSASGQPYSQQNLQDLAQAGIDVICNPLPGGSYFGARFGRNSSSQAGMKGDNHTRMTNYLAATLNSGMGVYVGLPITDDLLRQIGVTIDSFMAALVQQNMLDKYSTLCNRGNNPEARTKLGYVQVDVKAQYLAILENLLVNLEGGQTVTVQTLSTQIAA